MKRHASKHDRFWKKRGPRRSNGRRPPTHVNDYAERAMMIALWNNSWAPETNAQRRRRIVEENRAAREGDSDIYHELSVPAAFSTNDLRRMRTWPWRYNVPFIGGLHGFKARNARRSAR